MKRFFSILLSFALCFVSINSTVFAEEQATSTVSIENVTGKTDEIVNVPININNNPGIISLVVEVSYDNTALKLKKANKNDDFWKSATMTPGGDLNAQPYRIIWYDGLAKSDFTENGTLAELSFEVLKSGSHKIELSISEADTFNNNFEKVQFEVEEGIIEAHSTTTQPVEYKLGDVNNDGHINAVDASSVLSYYAMISTNQDGGYNDKQKTAGDVNHDGQINAVDASCILSYYAYLSTTKEEILSLEAFLKKK